MPKIYSIRWTKSDSEDLAKAVKNFNAKIKRLETKFPKTKNSLPQKVSMKEMKDLIKTRADFKREINALKRFSKKGAETLVTVPGNEYDLKITKLLQKKSAYIMYTLLNALFNFHFIKAF